MSKNYTKEFKQAVVKKALMPGAPSKVEIISEYGISPSALYRWVQEYGNSLSMKKKKKSKASHNWSPKEKLEALKDIKGLNEEELGAYLRSNGLHSHQLDAWNKEVLDVLKSKFYPNKKDPKVLSLEKEVKALQKSLTRKEKALAEAAALLILKKKDDDYFSGEE